MAFLRDEWKQLLEAFEEQHPDVVRLHLVNEGLQKYLEGCSPDDYTAQALLEHKRAGKMPVIVEQDDIAESDSECACDSKTGKKCFFHEYGYDQ